MQSAQVVMLRVGIGSRNYSYRRVCYDLPLEHVEFRKVPYVPWKFLRRSDIRWANTYRFAPDSRVDLFHLWNGVCLNRRPWITSFEADLPRYCGSPRDRHFERLTERIQSSDCKLLLALSDFARNRFFLQNEDWITDEVRAKTKVLYGAVEPWSPLSEASHASRDQAVDTSFRLVFVGHDFFRKGGVAILRAFEELLARGVDCRLTLVGRIAGEDYVTTATEQQAQRCREEVAAHPRIDWRPEMPFGEILAMMASHDLCLLPTLDDTFGWSVVEAQTVGVPVLTTNTCAMPELSVHGHSGLQVRLPLAPNRRWAGMQANAGDDRRPHLEAAYELISSEIVAHVERFVHNRNELREIGERGKRQVALRHSPRVVAARLSEYYESVL